MPNIVALRNALTSQLAKRLAAAGYPALAKAPDGTDGKILIGRQAQYEQSAPPRVLMVPIGSPAFGGALAYSSKPINSDEARKQRAQRPIMTEYQRFEFRCWGTSNSTDPLDVRDDDFTMTEALYEMLIQSMAAPAIEDNTGPAVLGPMTKDGWQVEAGAWTDATFGAPQNIVYGREFVFTIRIAKPILDRLYEFAPADVKPQATTNLTIPSGASDVGCGGP